MPWRAELRARLNQGRLSPRFRRLLVNRFQHNRGVLTSNFLLCGDLSSILRLATSGLIPPCGGKFPSVSRDAMTFVTGLGDTHDVRLLDHATVVSGSETAATVLIDISGDENMDGGID